MIFFKWLFDKLFIHVYFYKEPVTWIRTEEVIMSNNGKSLLPMVTKKKCKVCHTIVWSNNNHSICGSLRCWMKGNMQ